MKRIMAICLAAAILCCAAVGCSPAAGGTETGEAEPEKVLPLLEVVPEEERYYDDTQVEYNSHLYSVYSGDYGCWEELEEKCESMHGHLATISDARENSFLYSLVRQRTFWTAVRGRAHTGGYSRDGVNWSWVTGEPFDYSFWAAGEPNGDYNGVDILMFYSCDWNTDLMEGRWNDGDFWETPYFVCEWEYPAQGSEAAE